MLLGELGSMALICSSLQCSMKRTHPFVANTSFFAFILTRNHSCVLHMYITFFLFLSPFPVTAINFQFPNFSFCLTSMHFQIFFSLFMLLSNSLLVCRIWLRNVISTNQLWIDVKAPQSLYLMPLLWSHVLGQFLTRKL